MAGICRRWSAASAVHRAGFAAKVAHRSGAKAHRGRRARDGAERDRAIWVPIRPASGNAAFGEMPAPVKGTMVRPASCRRAGSTARSGAITDDDPELGRADIARPAGGRRRHRRHCHAAWAIGSFGSSILFGFTSHLLGPSRPSRRRPGFLCRAGRNERPVRLRARPPPGTTINLPVALSRNGFLVVSESSRSLRGPPVSFLHREGTHATAPVLSTAIVEPPDCAGARSRPAISRFACGQSQSCNVDSQFAPQLRSPMGAGQESKRDWHDRTAVQRRSGAGGNRCTRRELQSHPGKIRTRARGIFCDHAGKCPLWIGARAVLVVGALFTLRGSGSSGKSTDFANLSAHLFEVALLQHAADGEEYHGTANSTPSSRPVRLPSHEKARSGAPGSCLTSRNDSAYQP